MATTFHQSKSAVCGRLLPGLTKNIKAHNVKYGSSLKTFQFETELDEIFAKDPVMQPVKTILSASQVEESSEDSDQMELNKKGQVVKTVTKRNLQ
ncbi:hypothetical protein DPMN_149700 [Dreissena polymorpha]|uniref:Uncharacterized protein n=1 Tax=Dreissena polymorpha TaxID=45954 RepID=A0A9D4FC37_DREPO|nr:hypothetical protein DPMN_149700 [Dreissena polymorpha]